MIRGSQVSASYRKACSPASDRFLQYMQVLLCLLCATVSYEDGALRDGELVDSKVWMVMI